MSNSRKVAGNTIVQLGGKVVTTISSLILTAIITRSLGLVKYGDYFIILAYGQFFSVFSDFGINIHAVKKLSQDGLAAVEEVASMFSLRLLIAFLVLGIAALLAPLMPYSAIVKEGIYIMLVAIFAQTVNSLFVSVLQARLKMYFAALSEVIGRVSILIFTIIALLLHTGLMGVIVATTIGNLINVVLSYIFANRLLPLRLSTDRAMAVTVLRESIPIGITAVLSYIYFKVDSLILSAVHIPGKSNDVEAAIYGSAYKVLELLILIPTILLGNIFPLLAKYVHQDRAQAERLIERSFQVMALVSFPITTIVFMLAHNIMVFVAGAKFAPAAVPLQILSFAVLLTYFNGVFTYTALALEKQRGLIWVYGLAAIGNAISNYVLIPRYSYSAAAYTTLATELFVLVGAWWVSRQLITFKIPVLKMVHYLVVSLGVAFVLHYLQHTEVVLSSALALIMYGALVVATGAVSLGDIKQMLKKPEVS